MKRLLTPVLAPALSLGMALGLLLSLALVACGSEPPARPQPPYQAMKTEAFQALVAESQGPLVVAVMSASCSPCIQELPVLDALHRELRGQGLEVIGLSLDYSEDNLRHLLEKTGIKFPVYWTGEEAIDPMGIQYLPLLILYKDGRETGRLEGLLSEAQLREAFAALTE